MTTPGAGGIQGGVERSGGLAGDEKRRERAARKLEQQETEAAAGIDDVSGGAQRTQSIPGPNTMTRPVLHSSDAIGCFMMNMRLVCVLIAFTPADSIGM